MQIWGLARSLGARIVPFHLRRERNWAPDLDELAAAVSSRTKLIAICNPNNPTGAALKEAEMQAIVEAADRPGAWLLADEVYQGAERTGAATPSFWGRRRKTLIVNGLSKAYGLPGLRIGWVAGEEQMIADLWGRHDYTTITASTISDALARAALHPANRPRILERTRSILRQNYPLLEEWLDSCEGAFAMVPPEAGAIAWLRYSLEINSTRLAQKLREEKSVLVVPGDHFGMDGYLRINYGAPADCLRTGLTRIKDTMQELAAEASAAGRRGTSRRSTTP
jgi:aspartate/methionine/tyrosine aminotransferase